MSAFPMPALAGKDPKAVARGRAGARRRWGAHQPDVIRLSSLTPEQARLVTALVRAARAEAEREAAAPDVDPEAAKSEGTPHAQTTS